MGNFSTLLDLNFWFDISPDPLLPQSFRVLQIIFVAFIAAGLAARVFGKLRKSDYLISQGTKKVSGPFLVMGVLGLLLLLMDFERVAFLASRFWYAVWFLGLLVWMVFAGISIGKKFPAHKRELEKRQKLEKWLPKKK